MNLKESRYTLAKHSTLVERVDKLEAEKKKMLNITLDDLCLRYYQYHPTGGSLHVLLDDNNVSNAILAFCENNCIENSDPCGQLIVDFFWDMDERERTDFVEKGLYK